MTTSGRNHQRIPATIITGFLGSGKTTLLANLLRDSGGRRLAVIVNEFGELGIDGDILRACGLGAAGECPGQECPTQEGPAPVGGALFELTNGCLCCTVQEAFFPVMRELVERREQIDHILIETSGLALPQPLVQAFNWPEIRNACAVDAVLTVVDTPAVAAGHFAADPAAVRAQREADANLDHDPSLRELFEDQLSAADLVILSKTDLADADTCARVETRVRAALPAPVKILRSAAGGVDLSLLLGLRQAAPSPLQRPRHDGRHGHHAHHGHGEHHHPHFDALVIELPAVDRERLLAALHALVEAHTIFRVKGFVALADKPMRLLVHGVGRRLEHYFDRRWRPAETPRTQLVFIGRGLRRAALEAALSGAALEPASAAASSPPGAARQAGC